MKILATLDGSVISSEILPHVAKLAKAANAEVIVMTVARPSEGSYRGEGVEASAHAVPGAPILGAAVADRAELQAVETVDQALARIEADAQAYLDNLADPYREQGITIAQQVVIDEDVVPAILRAARQNNVDLIAMATHGRTGLRAIVQGSIANEVVHAGVFPVLLVRPGTKMA
jgi:nucleotide-binding universal stress UspA family protein